MVGAGKAAAAWREPWRIRGRGHLRVSCDPLRAWRAPAGPSRSGSRPPGTRRGRDACRPPHPAQVSGLSERTRCFSLRLRWRFRPSGGSQRRGLPGREASLTTALLKSGAIDEINCVMQAPLGREGEADCPGGLAGRVLTSPSPTFRRRSGGHRFGSDGGGSRHLRVFRAFWRCSTARDLREFGCALRPPGERKPQARRSPVGGE